MFMVTSQLYQKVMAAKDMTLLGYKTKTAYGDLKLVLSKWALIYHKIT